MNVYVFRSNLPTVRVPKNKKIRRDFRFYFLGVCSIFSLIRTVAKTMPLECAVELCEQWTQTITLFFDNEADAAQFLSETGECSCRVEDIDFDPTMALRIPSDFLHGKVACAFTPTSIESMARVIRESKKLVEIE